MFYIYHYLILEKTLYTLYCDVAVILFEQLSMQYYIVRCRLYFLIQLCSNSPTIIISSVKGGRGRRVWQVARCRMRDVQLHIGSVGKHRESTSQNHGRAHSTTQHPACTHGRGTHTPHNTHRHTHIGLYIQV